MILGEGKDQTFSGVSVYRVFGLIFRDVLITIRGTFPIFKGVFLRKIKANQCIRGMTKLMSTQCKRDNYNANNLNVS